MRKPFSWVIFNGLVPFILVALLAVPVVAQYQADTTFKGYHSGPWGKKKLSPEETLALQKARDKLEEAKKYDPSRVREALKELRDLMSDISGQSKAKEERELRSLIQDEIRKLQGEILTTYSPDGEPVFQSQDAKGWHRQFGAATLDNGRAIVNLNSSPAEGKQDVSFIADSTYRGVAWSLDTTSTNTYWVFPLSGTQILVKSSDGADKATVRFLLEGN